LHLTTLDEFVRFELKSKIHREDISQCKTKYRGRHYNRTYSEPQKEQAVGTSPSNLSSEISPVPAPDWKPETDCQPEPDWKQEVNERVAAHRTRRGKGAGAQATLPLGIEEKPAKSRARVAQRVAARYANAPSYSEVLAMQQRAAAAVATAITGTSSEATGIEVAGSEAAGMVATTLPTDLQVGQVSQVLIESGNDIEVPVAPDAAAVTGLRIEDAEVHGGDVEEWIAGNLIEFPRVLVAARKARPRLAEGPLREDATVDTDPEHSQLRIFEVEQQAISTTAQVDPVATEWSSIRLDAQPRLDSHPSLDRLLSEQAHAEATTLAAPLQGAPIADRLMAALVDGALVSLAFLAFVAVFVACTAHPPGGTSALAAAGATLAIFFLLYQFLFFSFGDGTPGMRYAQIALCTFDDENPTREELRRRIGALLLSACPLALGFAWALFDEDNLGWHDRMSRTYQRSYK
jgi:uncharacterized RDD family membrane protein YckC